MKTALDKVFTTPGLDGTKSYARISLYDTFVFLTWSPCPIKHSRCHTFLPCLGWETGNHMLHVWPGPIIVHIFGQEGQETVIHGYRRNIKEHVVAVKVDEKIQKKNVVRGVTSLFFNCVTWQGLFVIIDAHILAWCLKFDKTLTPASLCMTPCRRATPPHRTAPHRTPPQDEPGSSAGLYSVFARTKCPSFSITSTHILTSTEAQWGWINSLVTTKQTNKQSPLIYSFICNIKIYSEIPSPTE